MALIELTPRLGVVDRLVAGRAERWVRRSIEASFAVDPAAVARVRTTVLAAYAAQAGSAVAPSRRHAGLRRSLAAAAVVAVTVGGAAAVAIHHAPAPAAAIGRASGGMPATLDMSLAALDLSNAELKAAVAGGTGDPAAVAALLAGYRSDLARMAMALIGQPADAATAGRIRNQAASFAALGGSIPAADVALYSVVAVEFDAVISTLPNDGDGDGHDRGPGASNAGGNVGGHAGAGGPAKGKGSGTGKSSAGGTGTSNAGGNGSGSGHGLDKQNTSTAPGIDSDTSRGHIPASTTRNAK